MKIQLSFYFSTVQTVSSAAAFLPQGYSIYSIVEFHPYLGKTNIFSNMKCFSPSPNQKSTVAIGFCDQPPSGGLRLLIPALSLKQESRYSDQVVVKARVWIQRPGGR